MTTNDFLVALHCFAFSNSFRYRGIGRFDYVGLISHASTRGVLDKTGLSGPVWEKLLEEVHKGTEVMTLAMNNESIQAVMSLVDRVDWDQMPADLPREFEISASLGGLTKDADCRMMDEKAIVRVLRDRLNDTGVSLGNEIQILGFEIVDWPSAWSVPAHKAEWSKDPLDLNEHGLFRTWAAAQEAWEVYLQADDPDRGPIGAYRTVGVFGFPEFPRAKAKG